MVVFYAIAYTSPDGERETLTIYAYGDTYGAGVNAYTTDPNVPLHGTSSASRQLSSADTFDEASERAGRIADLIVSVVDGATLSVRQGDDVPV